jgi:predicted site-specific integrase-resolvase
MAYIPLRKAVEFLGFSPNTLRKYADEGKIKSIKNEAGQRLYDVESYVRGDSTRTATVCYCRVSSSKQRDDLLRQVAYMQSLYPKAEIIKDIGSGLNFKRKGLQTLLDRVLGNTCKLVVIAHKDRLCRFGFDLISWLCARQQTQVLVLNQANLSPEREMVEDILSIIHVFSCRLYGLRKYKKQVAEDSELPSVSSKGT